MALISRNWQIIVALIVAAGFIIGAYVLAESSAHPSVASASTETALLQAIATKDSDGDGLPDWEESLYGTDPNKVDTRGLGMTDGEAVAKGLIVPKAVVSIPQATSTSSAQNVVVDGVAAPKSGSLTDIFAKNFFTLYLQTKQANGGVALTEQQTNDIAQKAVAQLTTTIAPTPDFKTLADIKISDSGSDAFRNFAIAAEKVFIINSANASKSELSYLQDTANGDTSAVAHIASIAATYHAIATGLSVLPVPEELRQDDLTLINTLARIGDITNDFARVGSDPLSTMLALSQYPQAVLSMGKALVSIHAQYLKAQIVLPDGTPGASFVNVIPDIAAEQKAASQTP